MITEDYVSFETAKLLKEKGFNEGCRAHYGTDGSFSYEKYEVEASGCEMHNAILAPTLQMVMKWLREVQGYIINIWYDGKFWLSEVFSNKEFILIGDNYTNYEKACEAGIKYCLKNLI